MTMGRLGTYPPAVIRNLQITVNPDFLAGVFNQAGSTENKLRHHFSEREALMGMYAYDMKKIQAGKLNEKSPNTWQYSYWMKLALLSMEHNLGISRYIIQICMNGSCEIRNA